MKELKIIGIISLLCFSFFYVNQITELANEKSPLYQEIVEYAKNNIEEPVNAVINDETVIPGLNGIKIDIRSSYNKMRKSRIFDKTNLVYKEIKPQVSLDDNIQKTITEGNALKNSVSFIINNTRIKKYMESNSIKGDIIISLREFSKDSFLEQINNDLDNYQRLDKKLKENGLNNTLCITNTFVTHVCVLKEKQLVMPNQYLNSINIAKVKGDIKPGNIYYIEDGAKLDDFMILIDAIRYKGINIIYLSELIKEQRD